MALDTLKKIAAGGVFDQLGGGFHRYSTDPHWRVPHFEKLGYDNAMALHAYSDAYEASGDPDFARVAKSIVGYVNRELLDAEDARVLLASGRRFVQGRRRQLLHVDGRGSEARAAAG